MSIVINTYYISLFHYYAIFSLTENINLIKIFSAIQKEKEIIKKGG